MELTTSNLIKMVIALVVIVLIVLGLYFAMRFYIIPYFEGFGFELVYALVNKFIISL